MYQGLMTRHRERLGVARNKVRNHLASLYKRTNARSRFALIDWAREHASSARKDERRGHAALTSVMGTEAGADQPPQAVNL
ncbi:response regulator transcription factor (plasmid) [Roseomonas marmotae]|nr:response regulator transcription factor [Roseomonas marmotae]